MLCAWYAIVMHKIVYICTYSEMKSCRLTVCTWLLFWTLCRAGRFVYGLKLPLSTHKAIHIVSPPYLCDLLQHHRPTRSMHSSDILLLSVPRHNLDFGSRAFRVVAIQAAINGNKKLFAFNIFPIIIILSKLSRNIAARTEQILPGSTINLASRSDPHDSSDEQLVEFNSNERSFTIRDYSRRVRGRDRYWSLPTQFLGNKVEMPYAFTGYDCPVDEGIGEELRLV